MYICICIYINVDILYLHMSGTVTSKYHTNLKSNYTLCTWKETCKRDLHISANYSDPSSRQEICCRGMTPMSKGI